MQWSRPRTPTKPPYNHQIKRGAAASVESGGPARKVKGEC